MSLEAMVWALNLAPVPMDAAGARRAEQPNSACAFVLVGLANHAGPDGRDAFPGVDTLVRYTRLSERTVRTALDRLEDKGTIKPCDPEVLAAKIKRADRRPNGYDLCMERVRDDLSVEALREIGRTNPFLKPLIEQVIEQRGATAAPREPEPQERGAIAAPRESERGAIGAERGATASERGAGVAPEPSLTTQEPSGRSTTAPSLRDEAASDDGTASDVDVTPEPTLNQRTDALVKAWWDWRKANRPHTLPAQGVPAIKGMVKTALQNGKPERLVGQAMSRLAEQALPFSGGTLQTAIKEVALLPESPPEWRVFAGEGVAVGGGRNGAARSAEHAARRQAFIETGRKLDAAMADQQVTIGGAW